MSLKKLSSNNTRRADSKQAQVLAMLHSKQGATITTIDYGKQRSHELALKRFNRYTNAHSAAGFGMADIILSAPGIDYTKPQIVFHWRKRDGG